MKQLTPIAQFKVYPGQYSNKNHSLRGLFFWVLVYENQEEMLRKLSQEKHPTRCYASVISYRKEDRFGRLNNELGYILFNKDNLGSAVVSHEAVHAALTYVYESGKMKKLIKGFQEGVQGGWSFKPVNSEIDESEEILAYAVGDTTKQIYAKLYELEILK